jgi:hypothetical protein
VKIRCHSSFQSCRPPLLPAVHFQTPAAFFKNPQQSPKPLQRFSKRPPYARRRHASRQTARRVRVFRPQGVRLFLVRLRQGVPFSGQIRMKPHALCARAAFKGMRA